MDFNTIYKKHYNLVLNTAKLHTRRHEDAEDITSEIFIILFENIDTMHFENIRGWLTVTTKFKCYTHRRTFATSKGKVLSPNTEQPHTLLKEVPDTIPTQETTITKKIIETQIKEQISKAINELESKDQAKACKLYYVDKLSMYQISRLIERNQSTVSRNIKRGTKILREKLLPLYEALQ